MSRFDGKMLDGLVPYVAGEQPKDMKYIKLNTNENPYSPSPKVMRAINDFDVSTLKLYPDTDASELKEAVGEFYEIKEENIFCGNSSDEILAMAFMAFYSGKEITFPDITYSFYPVWCNIFDIKKQIIPLKNDWTIDFENFPTETDGIVICNPNAPTGIAVKRAQIEEVTRKNPNTLVLCDEAYIDFGGESCIELTREYDNILVVHTLSKSRCLAGARVGFAIGNAELISSLNAIKNSFNSYTLDRLTIKIASAAIKDRDYFENCRQKVIGTRDRAVLLLREIGFEVLDSSANFIFASPPKAIAAKDLYLKLKEAGILVRYWNKERIGDWIRITVGTDSEMKALIDGIKKIITNS